MSKKWGIWAILVLCIAAPLGHAQEPVPEGISPPREPQRQKRDRSPAAKFFKFESQLPAENFLEYSDESGNAFCDPNTGFEDDPFHCWVKGEVLYWMFSPQSLPTPLVTTVQPSTNINLANDFGAIGQPSTVILFGNDPLELGPISGGRATIGGVIADLVPVELTGFWLNQNSIVFAASTDGQVGSPLFARPILQTNILNAQGIPQEGVVLVGAPDQSNGQPGFAGAVDIRARSNLWGVEANAYCPVGASDTLFFDVTAGVKHAELNESLEITNSIESVNPVFVIPFNGDPLGFGPGNRTYAYDNFSTTNKFNGGSLGARTVLGLRRLGLIFDTKVAMGTTNMTLDIYGNSSLILPNTGVRGNVQTVTGGVLALPSNIGVTSVSKFTYIPEVAAHLVLKVTRNVRLTASYSAMYWSSVVRPGPHLDSSVDTRQIPTSFLFVPGFTGTTPARRFVETDFFSHGLALGLWIGF